jgi:hypothetical protein
MTNVLPDYETRTRNLAAYHLRETAETVVLDLNTGQPYRVAVPTFTPFQEPPTRPVPPLPQPSPNPPPTPAGQTAVIYPRPGEPVPGMRPAGYEPQHRAPQPRWAWALVGAGVASLAWALLGMGVLAVLAR